MIHIGHLLKEINLPVTTRAADLLMHPIVLLQITPTEISAWARDVKRQRLEQLEAEKKRMGEKQGSGATRRVLTPEGWVIAPSHLNANVLESERPLEVRHPDDANVTAAQGQAEAEGHIVEHEIGIAAADLRCFVVARRMLEDPKAAAHLLDLLPVEDVVSVQARLHKAETESAYRMGVLDGLAIADGKA